MPFYVRKAEVSPCGSRGRSFTECLARSRATPRNERVATARLPSLHSNPVSTGVRIIDQEPLLRRSLATIQRQPGWRFSSAVTCSQWMAVEIIGHPGTTRYELPWARAYRGPTGFEARDTWNRTRELAEHSVQRGWLEADPPAATQRRGRTSPSRTAGRIDAVRIAPTLVQSRAGASQPPGPRCPGRRCPSCPSGTRPAPAPAHSSSGCG